MGLFYLLYFYLVKERKEGLKKKKKYIRDEEEWEETSVYSIFIVDRECYVWFFR